MYKDAQTGKDCDSVKGKSLQTDEALEPFTRQHSSAPPVADRIRYRR